MTSRTRSAVALAAACAATLSACGGGSGGSGASAEQRLADAGDAIAEQTAIHIEGTQTDKDGPSRVRGDVLANGDLRVTAVMGAQRLVVISVAKRTYLKASAAFWRHNADAQVAAVLADRWVKAPTSGSDDLGREVDRFAPKQLGRCLRVGHGTLSLTSSGATTVVEDAGDRPGTAPGRLYLRASGKPLPVRIVQTGPRAKGPVDERCVDPDSTDRGEDLAFSYGHPVTLRAPRGAIDLDALHSSGSGGKAA